MAMGTIDERAGAPSAGRTARKIGMGKKDPESGPIGAQVAKRLFELRTVLIHGEVTSRLARDVTAQLLALAGDSDDDITVYIHSEGGHLEAGDSIHDMISYVKPRIRMIGTGWVASAAVHIYLAVPKQDRYSLPNTRFLIHQPMGGAGGAATDIQIEAEEILKARDRLNRLIADKTGQPLERVANDTDRNHWMSPEEARDYGIVGRIISSVAEL
jgi:ATP-dependent Clp protease protease subunit